ncbi:MAG: hypothetical protein ACJ76Y_26255 [Thermoanaerobaculia bacterium]
MNNNMGSNYSAAGLFESLASGRGTVKAAAIRIIDNQAIDFDREQLQVLIISALAKDFQPPTDPSEEEDLDTTDARGWLLAALGRLCNGNSEAFELVRRHIDGKYEPNLWARYWALEGLVAGKNPGLPDIARSLDTKDEHVLMKSFGNVILASYGDRNALRYVQEVEQNSVPEQWWPMLRALRIVPITVTPVVNWLISIVEEGGYSDIVYDAIIALGEIPRSSRQAPKVGQALATFLTRYRWPMYDAMRTKALIGLGKLRLEWTASVIIEELSDESPAIVYEAAHALESVLGVRLAVQRILEAAMRSGVQEAGQLANALRWMDRKPVVDELEAAMLSGSESQQASARTLLREVGGLHAFEKLRVREVAITQYLSLLEETEKKVRDLFEKALEEAQAGFKMASRMDLSVFAVGIVLIVVSAAGVLLREGTLEKWAGVSAIAAGGTGLLGILYSILVAKPRQQVRESVDHLMQLKIVFLGYLRQLHQVDQAYARRLLENEPLSASDVSTFTEMVGNILMGATRELQGRHAQAERTEPQGQSNTKSV